MIVSKHILSQAKRGDEVAINRVMSMARVFLTGFIHSRVRSKADREDLIQDILAAVYSGLCTYNFDIHTSFDGFLAGYAWNFINTYWGEGYVVGKKKGPAAKDAIPYAYRERPMSEVMDGRDFDEIEGVIDPDRIIS